MLNWYEWKINLFLLKLMEFTSIYKEPFSSEIFCDSNKLNISQEYS